jgi:hypothetical protein
MPVLATVIWLMAVAGGVSLGLLVSRSEAPAGPRPGGWGTDPPPGTDYHRSFPPGMAVFHAALGASALLVWILWVGGSNTTYGLGRWWGLAGLVVAAAAGLSMFVPWYQGRQDTELASREQRLAATGVFLHTFVGLLTVAAVIVAIIVG